jgi:hypothetical protein
LLSMTERSKRPFSIAEFLDSFEIVSIQVKVCGCHWLQSTFGVNKMRHLSTVKWNGERLE